MRCTSRASRKQTSRSFIEKAMLSQSTYPLCPDFCLQQGPVVDARGGAGAEIKSLKTVTIIRKSLEFVPLTAPPSFKQSFREPWESISKFVYHHFEAIYFFSLHNTVGNSALQHDKHCTESTICAISVGHPGKFRSPKHPSHGIKEDKRTHTLPHGRP